MDSCCLGGDGALALAVALTGCNDSGSVQGSDNAAAKPSSAQSSESSGSGSEDSDGSDGKETFRLGEASPEQVSDQKESKGAKFTVTPTKVQAGTKADLEKSGLKRDADDDPQVPVHVWSTLTHTSGKPMKLGDMDDDLVVRTDKDQRTRALIVLLGSAKWPNCPATDRDKEVGPGQSEKVCTAFLIPEGQKATAVELFQGFTKKPLEWPVNG
ncbi:hypothetical protein M1E25_02875 [Streptomyces sp. MTZ3.1]|uniref:Secreted protein n=2 Tax=Streptomyces meridianus TaxID=2938945 RepID=A0ABT0X176_9ACTN|nr:hypothetical protein [Streptomyces meridianus]